MQAKERMPTFSRWLPILLIFSTSLLLAQAQPISPDISAYLGMSVPLLNMNHLTYLLLAGLLAFCIEGRNFLDLVLLFAASLLGTLIYFVWGYIPGAELIVGLSVFFQLLLLWNPDRLKKYSFPLIAITALTHGILYGRALGAESETVHRLVFMATFTLVQVIATFGFGWMMRSLLQKSPKAYEGLEHLLCAAASGVALVFIVRGLS